ncbi:HAD family phosphatase [Candidatus Peregrinibacteria bacterium]|jgi:beta-phosphoglucomutase|nr:HAD family phosphatase [Candidatus Peregrinibacteria bacterium]
MYDISHKKCLIFDLDGTLAATERANALAYIHAFSDMGVEITEEEYEQYFGLGTPELIKELAPDMTEQEALNLRKLKTEYYKKTFQSIKLNRPLIQLLKSAMHTHSIGLATMGSKKNAMSLLDHFGLTDYFDYIVTRDDVEKAKPDPECFLKVATHLGAMPEDCLVFEDSTFGIEAAVNADMDYIKIEM